MHTIDTTVKKKPNLLNSGLNDTKIQNMARCYRRTVELYVHHDKADS
jgi:hypothetical protein